MVAAVDGGAVDLFECPISSSQVTGCLLNMGQSGMHNCNLRERNFLGMHISIKTSNLEPNFEKSSLTTNEIPSPTSHPYNVIVKSPCIYPAIHAIPCREHRRKTSDFHSCYNSLQSRDMSGSIRQHAIV